MKRRNVFWLILGLGIATVVITTVRFDQDRRKDPNSWSSRDSSSFLAGCMQFEQPERFPRPIVKQVCECFRDNYFETYLPSDKARLNNMKREHLLDSLSPLMNNCGAGINGVDTVVLFMTDSW